MDDKATAAKIVDKRWHCAPSDELESAIVAALQAARESAFTAHAADPAGRNYCHTAGDVSNALCREMETSNIMGGPLWWGEMYRRIGLELCRAFNAGRADALVDQKPPPGHIIDDAGVVRTVLGTLPVTADECVVGDGAVLYFPWTLACGRKSVVRAAYRKSICLDPDAYTDRRAGYSTREAAEAAKEGKA